MEISSCPGGCYRTQVKQAFNKMREKENAKSYAAPLSDPVELPFFDDFSGQSYYPGSRQNGSMIMYS